MPKKIYIVNGSIDVAISVVSHKAVHNSQAPLK